MLKTYFIILFTFPLYLISSLVKKNNNVFVFGAWYGKKYSDNSKYLFEEYSCDKRITAVWISKNKKDVKKIKDGGLKAHYYLSFKGIYYQMVAKHVFITHSVFSDLLSSAISRKTTIVQLWHGLPIKKIMYDDVRFTQKQQKYGYLLTVLPFLKHRYDYVVATSDYISNLFQRSFNVLPEQIILSKYPRNRYLNSSIKEKKLKRILYAPTFRNSIPTAEGLLSQAGFNFDKTQFFLEKNNLFLDIRFHPVNKPCHKLINLFSRYNNINLSTQDDIYKSLEKYEVLITDYSSIFFDYLLTENPIIFFPFDKCDYKENERDVYHDYSYFTGGHECSNWEDVILKIDEAFSHKLPFEFYRNQEKLKLIYHGSNEMYGLSLSDPKNPWKL